MEQSQLEAKLKEARQAVKDAKEDGEKEEAEKQVTLLEGKLEELAKSVAETRDKEKDQRGVNNPPAPIPTGSRGPDPRGGLPGAPAHSFAGAWCRPRSVFRYRAA